MIEEMVARANADPVVRRRGNFVDVAFGIGIGPETWLVRIEKGRVSATSGGEGAAFTLRAAADAWADFAKPVPPPGTHDILALFEGGRLDITGEALPLMRNLTAVKAVLDKMRATEEVK
jgi:hypothetical protein